MAIRAFCRSDAMQEVILKLASFHKSRHLTNVALTGVSAANVSTELATFTGNWRTKIGRPEAKYEDSSLHQASLES